MRLCLAVLSLIAITSCTGDITTTTAPSGTITTIRAEEPTIGTFATSSTTTTTTMSAATSTTTPEIDVEFVDAQVSGPDTFDVALGETVDIWVLSDVDDEIHVHGYDLFFDLEAGVPRHVSFVADVPGIFEVEVHTGHTAFFEIMVAG